MLLIGAVRNFLFDESGTTAVEYAVMLALILTAIIAGVTTVGGGSNGWWGRSVTEMEANGF